MREYFTTNQAAEYCGYSPETFRRHVRAHPLPRYGAKRNRLKRIDLDVWMDDPDAFKVIKIEGKKRSGQGEKSLSFAEQKRLVLGEGEAA